MDKVENGYLIVATTNSEQRAASLCAISIKINNPKAKVSLVVPEAQNVSKQYEKLFHLVIELPFLHEVNTGRTNDWQLYWATQYDNNIVIDCYSIVKENQSNMWNYLIDNHDICFSKSPVDFRGISIVSNEKEYEDIVHLKSNMYFFKKNDTALAYFKLLDPFMQNWKEGYKQLLEDKFIPELYDSDLMHSYIVNKCGILDEVVPRHNGILKSICMDEVTKQYINDKRVNKSWTEYLNTWVTSNTKLKIHNFAVTGTLHYSDNSFLTDEIYEVHEQYYEVNN